MKVVPVPSDYLVEDLQITRTIAVCGELAESWRSGAWLQQRGDFFYLYQAEDTGVVVFDRVGRRSSFLRREDGAAITLSEAEQFIEAHAERLG